MARTHTCLCGQPAEVVLSGLPVCRACYDDAMRCEGSIMPGVSGSVVVRRGQKVWAKRLPPARGP